jgi:SAM-dependent methyltransferase
MELFMYWSIERQVEQGKLISPKTGTPLVLDRDRGHLQTADGSEHYRILDQKIPLLLLDEQLAANHVNSSNKMVQDYQPKNLSKQETLLGRLKAFLIQDYRTKASVDDFTAIFRNLPENAFCLSIGGGPKRPHSSLVNLNIGPFPNVDIVADAHMLPYADNSVDVIYCEAVLEHLHDPSRAVREMHRVLKKGGKLFACTPFMQEYHGYPHHYQNYSLTGHRHLFAAANFDIVSSGVCVGPVYTMVSLTATFIHEFAPVLLRWPLQKAWGIVGVVLRPLDRLLNTRENAYILASTTYLVADKTFLKVDDV